MLYGNDVLFFKQKTGYEMRCSDWSSDVCSSDLADHGDAAAPAEQLAQPEFTPRAVDRALQRFGVDLLRLQIDDVEQRDIGEIGRRRVGKECVRTCRYRWSQAHYKQNHHNRDNTHASINTYKTK